MKKVFLVTRGDYSDYRVCAVFSDEKLAQKYIDSFNLTYDEFKIEDYELDIYQNELRENYKPFFLRMTKEGNCTEIRIQKESYSFEDGKIDIGFDKDKNMYISIFAKDEKHAIKIANEKRAQLIAENNWKQ
jgi:hypothetical protein